MDKKFFGSLQKLREKIRDEVTLGQNPYQILIDVADEISDITGEENFGVEIREKISALYAYALNEPQAIQIELEEVKARREKIKSAYEGGDFDEDTKRRIKFALDRHDAEIKTLEERLRGKQLPVC